jgi:hypothetical protein
LNTIWLSRPSRLSTAPSLMDVSSKFNSPETDLRATVPLVSREENPPPLSSVVTSASALTKIALLVSSNKSVPLLRSESPRPKMAVPRDSATLNSRKSMTPRELSINSTVKTSMDVMSDSTYQPTEVAVEAEEVIVADAVAVSEVVVEAVASAAAVVEATDSEAAATGSVTEEAVAASEEAAMATEETDHLTAVTVTEEAEVIVHTEVTASAALVVIAAVTDVADSVAAVVVVVTSEEIVAEEAAIEAVVEVSNGIE